jgi:ribosomal protein L30E
MNSNSKGSVIVGSKVELESISIEDPTVVAAYKAVQEDNRDLVEYTRGALEIGVKALQVTGVSLGIEQLSDSRICCLTSTTLKTMSDRS